MIDLRAASELLDLGASIGQGHRADEQLQGAVAIHNILEARGVAYLADEVGMGKTYVALGAMALFRHFDPEFRVLVIAPRENIQDKWMKELGNLCANNVRFADLRVKSLRGGPARPMVACRNLHEFVHETAVDPRRDFFLRMTSFSMGLSADEGRWVDKRDGLKREIPWLADEAFALRKKEAFKDNYARAVCCAVPTFDLVIVDEGHNLKHGFREGVAARNRMLALAMGRDLAVDRRLFPGYGRRARRVLFLSATPIEESYVQLWNQLDLFGLAGPYGDLKRHDATEEEKKAVVAQFLVRRVTTMQVHGSELTKNQYRREWRQGGVREHDEAIQVADPRKRLVVALVQKKVAELLGSSRFNMSFQIGMLASFESFLQTAKVHREVDAANFDDREQVESCPDEVVKEGMDVGDVNRLSRDYYKKFGHRMPHPKMDEVVKALSTAWLSGKKALVFVRRVASVKELKQKLDEQYDEWLIGLLRADLPVEVAGAFDGVVTLYEDEKSAAEKSARGRTAAVEGPSGEPDDDPGGSDSFFAWFFRGEGPKKAVSGARIARRFIQSGSAYRTFFERNYLAEILRVAPGEVAASLAKALGCSLPELRSQLEVQAMRFLSARKTRHPVYERFFAAQAAGLELLGKTGAPGAAHAQLVYEQVFQGEAKRRQAGLPVDVLPVLEERTFFTEILRPEWQQLLEAFWPGAQAWESLSEFRESDLRARLLATTARLGHGLIDMYLLTIARLKSLEPRRLESDDSDGPGSESRRILDYLRFLEAQRSIPLSSRRWSAFDELREAAENFNLVLDVNAPEARAKPLSEVARLFGTLLGQQQPVGGMSGQVNRTLVQQFRMPGYPFVLVTTDLLQEGEDLHTFCSAIHHYGISWTPSSMEQRVGRIDRVRSQTDRRLSTLYRAPAGEDLLQVHFPHLRDTVEILQVERVLERMNVFLRLMHEGLIADGDKDRHIDVEQILVRGRRPVEVISKKLESAFNIRKELLKGEVRKLEVTAKDAHGQAGRLDALRSKIGKGLHIEWSPTKIAGQLFGTMRLATGRIQPFTLLLDSLGRRLLLRCISPVGVVVLEDSQEEIVESVAASRVRIGGFRELDGHSYNLTVQEDVLLAGSEHDSARATVLLRRVGVEADRLEKRHLRGADSPLDRFQDDLVGEGKGRL